MGVLTDPTHPELVKQVAPKEAFGAHDCQKHCAKIEGCAHFSFWQLNATSGAGFCHFQDAYAVKRESRFGFTAGPAECPADGDIDLPYMASIADGLPEGVKCAEVGVTYSPIQAMTSFSGDQMAVISACKAFCVKSKDCAHFTIQFPMGFCSLHPVNATKLAGGIMGALSAPVMCPEDLVFRKKYDAARVPALAGASLSALGACTLLGVVAAAAATTVLARARRAHSRLAPAGSLFEALAAEEEA